MGLYQNILNEPVSSLSLRAVIKVPLATTVREALGAMRQGHLGFVVVVDEEDLPIGMFSEGALIHLLERETDALEESVGEHLDVRWARVRTTDPISMVLEAMQSRDLRFICVVDEEGRAVASTGQKGLMEYIAEHFPEQVQVTVHRVGVRPYDDRFEGA